jgi:hypothetical protein
MAGRPDKRASRRSALAEDGDDPHPLIVPRNDRKLVPVAPARIRKLKRHLIEALRAAPPKAGPADTPPPLTGFTARVAQAACTLCRGWCCRNGGEHAYLDERTIARLCRATPGLGARAILRAYTARVPVEAYEGSCIFHARQGCTLAPDQRSDVCNTYFCGGLGAYVTSGDPTQPVTIFAGEGKQVRSSPVLRP